MHYRSLLTMFLYEMKLEYIFLKRYILDISVHVVRNVSFSSLLLPIHRHIKGYENF